MDQNVINKLFKSVGFGFPESSEEQANFDSIYSSYSFKADVNSVNPYTILQNIRKYETKVSRIDYHKRAVLAAEIVFQLKGDLTLGHLKLQKMLYLCQNAANMPLHANFSKQALGPYDPVLMRSLDKQFKTHKWFEYTKEGKYPQYVHLENAGSHKEWYENYYHDFKSKVDFLIDSFKNVKTSKIELVATIYACWVEIFYSNDELSNELIIKRVYEWSQQKQKFSVDEIETSIKWMIEIGVHPNGNL